MPQPREYDSLRQQHVEARRFVTKLQALDDNGSRRIRRVHRHLTNFLYQPRGAGFEPKPPAEQRLRGPQLGRQREVESEAGVRRHLLIREDHGLATVDDFGACFLEGEESTCPRLQWQTLTHRQTADRIVEVVAGSLDVDSLQLVANRL